jgi:tetratricopeptide (TPR) repeat protein
MAVRKGTFSFCVVWTMVSVLSLGILVSVPLVDAQELPDALELYRAGRYQEAVETTLKELEINPGNMNSYSVLGWSLLALNRYQDALRYGTQALRIARSDYRIVQIVAEAQYRLGNYTESLRYYQEYVALNATGSLVPSAYYAMGEIHIRFEEFNRADIALSAAVHYNPRNSGWWSRLGYAREQAGNHESALEAYEEALRLNPSLSTAREGRDRVREILSSSG